MRKWEILKEEWSKDVEAYKAFKKKIDLLDEDLESTELEYDKLDDMIAEANRKHSVWHGMLGDIVIPRMNKVFNEV